MCGCARCRRIEELELRPEAFLAYLTSPGFGLQLVRDLNTGSQGVGFDRPFYVLRKPLPAA